MYNIVGWLEVFDSYLSPLNSCLDFSNRWQNSSTILRSCSSFASILTRPSGSGVSPVFLLIKKTMFKMYFINFRLVHKSKKIVMVRNGAYMTCTVISWASS